MMTTSLNTQIQAGPPLTNEGGVIKMVRGNEGGRRIYPVEFQQTNMQLIREGLTSTIPQAVPMAKVQQAPSTSLQRSWNVLTMISSGIVPATRKYILDIDAVSFRLAILGLTFQYITSRISRESYDDYHARFYDEVSRLNHRPDNDDDTHFLMSVSADDMGVRTSDELRFMLFRHWTLYDAMFHSSYVASKMGIWKEKGRSRLTGLLAKMGFSIPQTQQPYSHMDIDLKKSLIQKLNDLAPEYGMVELSYPSFMRCYGFHMQPLSAADAVEGISALLDAAGGMRIEVEIEGMRNGGEWFGAGRIWEGTHTDKPKPLAEGTHEPSRQQGEVQGANESGEVKETGEDQTEPPWWVKNFWTAYDALSE
ncbi:hypothetical protein D9613_002936 [Agrocybe pediades]|uniref:Uncharacterized protein n=1 Tax=Agrocybe pediades TaxID=84607 RepID=A0A8H4QPT4_9AGAR|nr:hypothetical protein D9613_002936 [Agrocybe pediades]